MQPGAVLIQCLHDNLDVGMGLVGAQDEGISMSVAKLLPKEVAARGEQSVRWRALGHAEHDFVNELREFPRERNRQLKAPSIPFQVEVHVLHEPVANADSVHQIAGVRLKRDLAVTRDALDMLANRFEVVRLRR